MVATTSPIVLLSKHIKMTAKTAEKALIKIVSLFRICITIMYKNNDVNAKSTISKLIFGNIPPTKLPITFATVHDKRE